MHKSCSCMPSIKKNTKCGILANIEIPINHAVNNMYMGFKKISRCVYAYDSNKENELFYVLKRKNKYYFSCTIKNKMGVEIETLRQLHNVYFIIFGKKIIR